MEHKIINIENYILIVNDDEIKDGDYYLSKISNNVFRRSKDGHWNENYDKKMYHKVICHLPLNNSPILEGVDLLPPLEQENDVEKLVSEHYDLNKELNNPSSFKAGYNKAKEKYSLTNILDLYIEETGYGMDMWSKEENEVMTTIAKIIQSLSQPKMPIAFKSTIGVCETWMMNECNSRFQCCGKPEKPKTTTNSGGETLWVGEWIY